jgi:DNA replication factor GINS
MNDPYEHLKKAWEQEMNSKDLQVLMDGFFPEVTKYIAELNSAEMNDDTLVSRISLKEREYSNTMLKELSGKRLEKIVRSELEAMPLDSRSLTPEEQRFHANLRQVISDFRKSVEIPLNLSDLKNVTGPSETRGEDSPKLQEKDRNELVVVRFLQQLPAIMGVDMKAYGPFKQEDVASIPNQNAVNLIRRGIAKLVEIEP